jgi:signal transduction histidine kinase
VGDVVEAAQLAGFPVRLPIEGRMDSVPADVRFAVTRIVQESLTNAMRHAPTASHMDVRIVVGDDVDVEIVNDGVRDRPDSASGPRGGYGLPGLRERAAHVGGELTAGPGEGGRWIVRASLPVSAAAGAAALEPWAETP